MVRNMSGNVCTNTDNRNGFGESRLAQIQAQIQRRQQADKEQKLLSLLEQKGRVGSALSSSSTGGKVRQLFEERRFPRSKSHGAGGRGWDKGFPLEPLNKRGAQTEDKRPFNGNINLSNTEPINLDEINHNLRLKDKFSFNKPSVLQNDSTVLNNVNVSIFSKLPNIGGPLLSEQKTDQNKVENFNSQNRVTTNTSSPAKDISVITKGVAKLPVSPKKKINKQVPLNGMNNSSNGVIKTSPAASKPGPKPRTVIVSPTKTAAPTATGSSTIPVVKSLEPPRVKPFPAKTNAPTSVAAKKTAVDLAKKPVPPGLVQCSNCYRNFAPDRIEAHKKICLKTTKKKRKAFDPVKQRLKGTEAEQFVRKGSKAPPPQTSKKSNWRKKHEEFINNIRAAKLAQEHVAAGGKLSDLPPPPPLDTSDLTPCPHCGRKFNDNAAARHIPRCADINSRTKPIVKKKK